MASELTASARVNEQNSALGGADSASSAPRADTSPGPHSSSKTPQGEEHDRKLEPAMNFTPSPSNSTGSDDLRNPGAAELQNFQERFRAVESKVGLVDVMYGLHESTTKAMEYGGVPKVYPSQTDGQAYREHLSFYADAMFFMSRLRTSHNFLVRYDEKRKKDLEAEGKKQVENSSESEITKEISSAAFLKGERAKVMQVEWDAFLFRKGPIEKSIMTPIEVVSGEPEPRVILQLVPANIKRKMGKSQGLPQVERILPAESGDESVQRPLPERIKIHSGPLVAIFSQIDKVRQMGVSSDGSMVLLRPYQQLIYWEDQLRVRLSSLESRFETYHETKSSTARREVLPDDKFKDGTGVSPAVTSPTSIPNIPFDEDKESGANGNVGRTTVDEQDDIQGGDDTSRKANKEGETQQDSDDDDVSRNAHEEDETQQDGSTTSITALLHLRCLMAFVDTEIKPKQAYINSTRCSRIHFHDLWHLFKPGSEVIQQDGKQVYVVLRVQIPSHKVEEPWERWNRRALDDSDSSDDEGGKGTKESERPFTLHCAYIDFDGKSFGPVSRKFKISPFREFKLIKSLPVYPFRFAKDSQARQDFISRGKMLLEIAKFKAMYYMGMTLDKQDEIDSQVVIDFNEALADEERRKAWEPTIGPINTAADKDDEECIALCCVEQAIHDGFDKDSKMTEDYIKTLIPDTSLGAPSLILSPRSLEDTLNSIDELTETEFLIMTYRVFGFVLRSRKWAQLDLALLRYENSNARNLRVNAFERLELPEGHREMVKSLVIQHFRARQSVFTKDEQTDLIQGKGKGLIILLHGAPGVGKTTTAEGIAELFRKPLFQITCGDLGTTAKEVETELEKNFALASRWGCILLLDEADVFLSARERMDFKRNGLVAVFLRVLEYYTGILFLTTNRIGDFDEAFASRIHMSLYYPELDQEKTLKVFKLNLDLIQQRFDKQGRSIIFDMSSIEDFAQQHFIKHVFNRWNGRQIRNACQTALALAEFDSQGSTLEIEGGIDKNAVVRLELKYFKTVQRAYLDFDQYLGDIQGTQGDRRAIDFKLRSRADTPYQTTKRNLFSRRDGPKAAPAMEQNLNPHDLHNRSSSGLSSNFGSQADPFNQSYPPGTPSANLRDPAYGQYPYQGNTRQAPVGNIGGYESSTLGHSQQDYMDAGFSQGIHGQHFEPPQRGIHGRQTPQRQGMGYDGSPVANLAGHNQQSHYGYGNTPQGTPGGGFQNPSASMQDTSGLAPHSIFRQGQEGSSIQGNPPSLGDNSPHM